MNVKICTSSHPDNCGNMEERVFSVDSTHGYSIDNQTYVLDFIAQPVFGNEIRFLLGPGVEKFAISEVYISGTFRPSYLQAPRSFLRN